MFVCALSLLSYNGENLECLMLNRRNQDQRQFVDSVKKKNIQNYLRWMVKEINEAAILELRENFLLPEVYKITSDIMTYTLV